MSFYNIRLPDWAAPADPTDLALIAQAENGDGYIPTTESDDESMDLDWREAEEFERVKLSSQETAAFEQSQRSANAEAERLRAEEDKTHLALSASRRLAAEEMERQEILEAQRQSAREAQELEDMQEAKLQSLSDERARARAARKNKEQGIIEKGVEAERERKRKAEETIRLKVNFAIGGLSEEEQFEYAKFLSRVKEHSHDVADVKQTREDMRRFIIDKAQADELSVAQGIHGYPVLGAMAPYPPGPVTEREQESAAAAQEFIEHPNALFRPLTPTAEISESWPTSSRSVAGTYGQCSNIVPATATTGQNRVNARLLLPPSARTGSFIRAVSSIKPASYLTIEENPERRVESFEMAHSISNESQISDDPRAYPGAYHVFLSQASSVARSTVGRSVSEVKTPKLPGVYPPSCASGEASRGFAEPPSGIPSWMIRVARRPLDDIRSSERLIGAYPPSSQASNAPSRSGTVSSEDTFVTAREMQSPQRYAQSQPALSEFRRDESSTYRECEAQEFRPLTSLSCSSPSSKVSCVGRPPSSQTSHKSDARKRITKSRPLIPTAVKSRVSATAPDAATASVVAPSHSQQHPAQYNFYGPVTVNNYTVPGEPSSSSTMFKQVLTKGKEFAKGAKVIEQKNVAGLDPRSIGEATKSRCRSTAAFLKQKSNRFEVSLLSRATHAPVSEFGEIDQVSVPEVQDDVGSIAPLPQTQQWFVTNPDLNRSYLNTPEDGRSLRSEFLVRQTVDVDTLRTPTLQRSVRPPSLATITQRRPISLTPSAVSMILNVNGDALTPPNDRQSGFTSSFDDGSFVGDPATSGPAHDRRMPRALSIHKTPPPVPRKPHDLAGSRSAKLPPRNRNPISRYMAEAQEGPAEWLQQPVQFPIMHPTQGPAHGSPDTMMATAPSPGRVNGALNRRSNYPPIDTDLANVPPGERRIDEFDSRSTADLGRMGHVGVPASMEVLRKQYKQTYARPPQDRQERQNSDARARVKEKETQKFLRLQV